LTVTGPGTCEVADSRVAWIARSPRFGPAPWTRRAAIQQRARRRRQAVLEVLGPLADEHLVLVDRSIAPPLDGLRVLLDGRPHAGVLPAPMSSHRKTRRLSRRCPGQVWVVVSWMPMEGRGDYLARRAASVRLIRPRCGPGCPGRPSAPCLWSQVTAAAQAEAARQD
jgi:hypothetical protein